MPFRNNPAFINRERPSSITEQLANIVTSSKKRMVLTALTGWLFATTVTLILFQTLLTLMPDTDTRLVVNATVLGGVFGLLVMLTLVVIRERRQHMRDEIRQIAELNHHVRNALQAISYSTFAIKDAQLIEIVNESVERIDGALRAVLPVVGERAADGLFKSVIELISFGIYREGDRT